MKMPWTYLKKVKDHTGDRSAPKGKPFCPRCDRTESVCPPTSYSPWTCTYCCEDIIPQNRPLSDAEREERRRYQYGDAKKVGERA